MLTITSKTTKNDLIAEVERLRKERKTVVDTARQYAKEYRWCEVVDECLRDAGLGDMLPEQYHVEEKRSARSRWNEWDGPYESKDDAIECAIDVRNDYVAAPRSRESVQFNTYLYPETDLNETIAELKRLATMVKPQTFKAPKYPIFRVVLTGGGRTEPEVIAVVDHTEPKEI